MKNTPSAALALVLTLTACASGPEPAPVDAAAAETLDPVGTLGARGGPLRGRRVNH